VAIGASEYARRRSIPEVGGEVLQFLVEEALESGESEDLDETSGRFPRELR
jgi:hypothetical protein